MEKCRTFFIDIDGTILEHQDGVEGIFKYRDCPIVLPNVKKKFQEWHDHGDIIVLTTARLPSMRDLTVAQLNKAGIYYHHLIMGCGRGERVVINDTKKDMSVAALAFTVPRDEGLGSVNL